MVRSGVLLGKSLGGEREREREAVCSAGCWRKSGRAQSSAQTAISCLFPPNLKKDTRPIRLAPQGKCNWDTQREKGKRVKSREKDGTMSLRCEFDLKWHLVIHFPRLLQVREIGFVSSKRKGVALSWHEVAEDKSFTQLKLFHTDLK